MSAPVLFQDVLDQLGRRIVDGDPAPGEAVTLAELVDETGASRTVVREVVRVLEALGMVRSRRRVGLTVRPPTEWDALDARVLRWRLRGADRDQVLADLRGLREVLDPLCARAAAAAAPKEVGPVLMGHAETLRRLAPHDDEGSAFRWTVTAFRLAVVEHAGNSLLTAMGRAWLPALADDAVEHVVDAGARAAVAALYTDWAGATARGDRDAAARSAERLARGAWADPGAGSGPEGGADPSTGADPDAEPDPSTGSDRALTSTAEPARRGAPVLVAVDWGTTSCRAHLVTATGEALASATGRGLLPVLETVGPGAEPAARDAAFAAELEAMAGPWREAAPHLPVLLCGMVGADRGWADAGYRTVPTPLAPPDQDLAAVRDARGTVHIAPGVNRSGDWPDVMRGEETQVLGAVGGLTGTRVVVTPGTHSKWIVVGDGVLEDFATYMTGEVFAALRDHTILRGGSADGAGSDSSGSDGPGVGSSGSGSSGAGAGSGGDAVGSGDARQRGSAAFDRGLDLALDPSRPALTRSAFTARSAVLDGSLEETEVADHLSGLAIGTEIADARALIEAAAPDGPVIVIAGAALSARYLHALDRAGIAAEAAHDDVTVLGLLAVARGAGLLDRAGPVNRTMGR